MNLILTPFTAKAGIDGERPEGVALLAS